MEKRNLAFGKKNYIICAVSAVMIIMGFLLMMGPASSIEGGFEPDIFSTRRIVVAPMVCFFGFLLMIVGILYTEKKAEQEESVEEEISQNA